MDADRKRLEMVASQIQARGVKNPLVLDACRKVPRHEFVSQALKEAAYEDSPLPIGHGQTISQPYIVALMAEAAAVQSTDTVLEIGTGSGYAAAIMAQTAKQVYTIERVEPLAKEAIERFKKLGYSNIEVKIGDGTLGLPEKAPFDAIIVTAGAPIIPSSLTKQLKEGGRLIIPVGDALVQHLLRIRKKEGKLVQEMLEAVRFVPLIGEEGWNL